MADGAVAACDCSAHLVVPVVWAVGQTILTLALILWRTCEAGGGGDLERPAAFTRPRSNSR